MAKISCGLEEKTHRIQKKWNYISRVLFIFVVVFCSHSVVGQNAGGYAGQFLSKEKAVLQGLNKITARVSTFTLKIDELGYFGTLVIKVKACRKRPPTEPPESAAYIEILDKKMGEEVVNLFGGWMFASSPTLNSLEHPVYDIWVLDCTNSKT